MPIARRSFLAALGALLASAAAPASARCAHLAVATEARGSRYVLEGTIESVDADGIGTVRVTAVWLGTPPATVRVGFRSGRFRLSSHHVGETWLVFAEGASDASLAMNRCGSSGPVLASVTAALSAAGYHRTSR